MFDAGQYIFATVQIALITFYGLHTQKCHQIRVFTVCLAYTSPAGIAGYFHIRIKRPMHVHGTHFFCCLAGYPVSHQRIERTSQVDIGGIYRVIGRIGIAMDGIDTEDNRYLQAALHGE